MKKLYLLLLLTLGCASLSAQNPTTYFMEGTPLRSQWNPAFAPNRGYVNIPVIGGIQVNTESNLSLDCILYPTQSGGLTTLFDSSVSAEQALRGLDPMNYLSATNQISLIGFGAYRKDQRTFWAFDLSLKSRMDSELPYELFDFMKRGNSASISNLGANLESYAEAAFTYSFPIKEKIHIGIRGKFLIGLSYGEMRFSQLDAVMGADRWYAHAVGDIQLAGMNPDTYVDDMGRHLYDFDDLSDDLKIPAGYGFGFDLGVTYDPLPELQLSASVNDLGALFWTKSASSIGHIDEMAEFSGVKSDENGELIQPEFDFDELLFEVAPDKGISRMTAPSIQAGAEYNFLDRRIGLGTFYSLKIRPYHCVHNLTFAANFRPLKWLHLSGSYSFIDNCGSAVGLALNLCPKFINFFVATDMLFSKKSPQWVPINQKRINITFGLSVPMGPTGARHQE
jgi:hypothetical protein